MTNDGVEDAPHDVGRYICCRYSCTKTSEVDTEMGAMCREHASPLMFPIQRPWELRDVIDRMPHFVPWEFIRPHEHRARVNHGGQTLARLAQRGGLSLREVLDVLHDRCHPSWRVEREAAVDQFLVLFDAWREAQ